MTFNVPDRLYDLGLKCQGRIHLHSITPLTFINGGCNHLANWNAMVCRWRRMFWIANMTFGSKVKVNIFGICTSMNESSITHVSNFRCPLLVRNGVVHHKFRTNYKKGLDGLEEYLMNKIKASFIELGGKLILESNLHIQDGSQIAKDNMFLQDVLDGWCNINAPESTHVIAKEITWNNSQIKCNIQDSLLPWLVWKEDTINRTFFSLEQLQKLYTIHQNDFPEQYIK